MVNQPIVVTELIPELKEKFYVHEKYQKSNSLKSGLELYCKDKQPVRLYLVNSMVIEGEVDRVDADNVVLFGHNDDFVSINLAAVALVEVFNPEVNNALKSIHQHMQQSMQAQQEVPVDEVADTGFSVINPS